MLARRRAQRDERLGRDAVFGQDAHQEPVAGRQGCRQARADAAAAGAGLTIDRVLRIEEGEHMQPQPLRPMIAMRSEATRAVRWSFR